MKTKTHLDEVAVKLIECRELVKQVSDRMSQGADWDLLQSAMVTIESAAGSLVDSNAELDREVAQMKAESAKAVSDAVAQASAVKIGPTEVTSSVDGSGVGSFI